MHTRNKFFQEYLGKVATNNKALVVSRDYQGKVSYSCKLYGSGSICLEIAYRINTQEHVWLVVTKSKRQYRA